MATTWLLHVHVSGSDMPAIFTVEMAVWCRLCWGILLCSLYTCTSLASIGIHYSMMLKLLYMKQCTCTSHYKQEELNCLTSHWTSPLPASLHIEPVLCLLYFILKAVPQTFMYFTTIPSYLHVFVFLFILWVHLISIVYPLPCAKIFIEKKGAGNLMTKYSSYRGLHLVSKAIFVSMYMTHNTCR